MIVNINVIGGPQIRHAPKRLSYLRDSTVLHISIINNSKLSYAYFDYTVEYTLCMAINMLIDITNNLSTYTFIRGTDQWFSHSEQFDIYDDKKNTDIITIYDTVFIQNNLTRRWL